MKEYRFNRIASQLHPIITCYSNLLQDCNAPYKREPVWTLGLCARSMHALRSRKIRTIGELLLFSRHELLQIRNMGIKCVTEIEEALRARGLKLED